jgi:hypothetical protein
VSTPAQRAAPAGLGRLRAPDTRTLLIGAAALVVGFGLGVYQRRSIGLGPSAIPDVLRVGAAAAALWFACGYAVARVLTPGGLRAHATLLSFPVGAVTSALALTVLGLARVPFDVALGLVISAGAVAGIAVRRARGALGDELSPDEAARPVAERVLWPLYVGVIVAAIALSPVWRTGKATVVGQNGDAVLVVGSAELLQHAPPTAIRAELPVDRVPLVWRSKYPIFYSLAAVARLSGRSPIVAFPVVLAGVLAMAAFGFFLLARYPLGAGPAGALLAMALAGLDRMGLNLAFGPFYNQAWALLALPFVLVAGWSFLRAPGRASLGLLLLFAALGAFAYPLMLPFPVLFLAVGAWRERERLRGALRRPRGPAGRWIVLALVAGAGLAVLFVGVFEKVTSAAVALSPWGSLDAWSGEALPFLPFHWFFGLVDPGAAVWAGLLLAGVLAAAAWGLARAPRDAAVPLAVTLAAALAAGVYFRHRAQAELFYLREMTLVGPLVVTCAAVGLSDLARRVALPGRRLVGLAGAAGIAVLIACAAVGDRRAIDGTFDFATRGVLELRDWGDRLPPGTSVRIDVPPSGWQLWSAYMLNEHPVNARDPLVGFFPYPPLGRKADYVLAMYIQPRPADAIGPPVFSNPEFRLWRMDPAVPGPDTSSRRMVDSITTVNIL